MLIPILEMDMGGAMPPPTLTISPSGPTYIQHTVKPLAGLTHLVFFLGMVWSHFFL